MVTKRGTNKKDKLKGTSGNDKLIGLGGNDTLDGAGNASLAIEFTSGPADTLGGSLHAFDGALYAIANQDLFRIDPATNAASLIAAFPEAAYEILGATATELIVEGNAIGGFVNMIYAVDTAGNVRTLDAAGGDGAWGEPGNFLGQRFTHFGLDDGLFAS